MRTPPSTCTLQITGSITYNGLEASEFCVPRTAGMVGQHDLHIPNLTVQETADFAFDCQNSEEMRQRFITMLDDTLVTAEEAQADRDKAAVQAAAAEEGKVRGAAASWVKVKAASWVLGFSVGGCVARCKPALARSRSPPPPAASSGASPP